MHSVAFLIMLGGAQVPHPSPPPAHGELIPYHHPNPAGCGAPGHVYGPPPVYYGQTWTYGALNPYYVMGYPDFFHKIGHFSLAGQGVSAYGCGMPIIYPQAPPRPFIPLLEGEEPPADQDEPEPTDPEKPERETMNVPADRAAVVVMLPADARLRVNGQPTSQISEQRRFHTPTLQTGHRYHYTIQVEYQRDGRTIVNERRVDVMPGQVTTVEFQDQGASRLVRTGK